MKILGIDIGTTTITALILDTAKKEVIKSSTVNNDSFVDGRSFERIQSVEKIVSRVKEAVKSVCDDHTPDAIGITGQMHGILYLDKDNRPCSHLMIWQDERGNLPYKSGETYAEFLTRETGIKSASGFGLTTHFYNMVNSEIPKDAVMLSTIHDYIASLITSTKPVTHSSDGASLGFFNLKEKCFDENALKIAGIDKAFLPEVISSTAIIGKSNCDFVADGIPVAVAIGDNQASFLGSVCEPESSILVNVGTGSQISFVTEDVTQLKTGEIRPLTDDKYIFVGASLCGGRAYAVLKNFFSLCADMLGGSKDNLYKKMDELSENIFSDRNELLVNCEFCGSRENPTARGSITNIGTENFTPENLICGVLKGVSKELKDMYSSAKQLLSFTPKKLVCSGNGLRKSEIWRKVFENDFNLPSELPKYSEEACVGACVFASSATGEFNNIETAQNNLLR